MVGCTLLTQASLSQTEHSNPQEGEKGWRTFTFCHLLPPRQLAGCRKNRTLLSILLPGQLQKCRPTFVTRQHLTIQRTTRNAQRRNRLAGQFWLADREYSGFWFNSVQILHKQLWRLVTSPFHTSVSTLCLENVSISNFTSGFHQLTILVHICLYLEAETPASFFVFTKFHGFGRAFVNRMCNFNVD